MQNGDNQTETADRGPDTGLTDEQQTQGMRYTMLAATFGALMFMVFARSAIGALFIKELGGSDFQAMLPGSIMALAGILRIPVSMKVPPRRGKKFMERCWFIAAGLMAISFAAPSVFGQGPHSVMVFLVVFAVAMAFSASGGAFWFPMLHDLVPVHRRGRFFGKMRAIWSSTSFVIILLSGFFLGKNPEIWQFQVVFVVILILYTTHIFVVRKIPSGNNLAGDLDYDHWKHYVKGLLREKPLLVFLGYYGLLGFCVGFLIQPLVLYMNYRGFPVKDNVIIFSFSTIGMIISFLFTGVLVDRFGTKRIFLFAHLILCLVSFFMVGIGMLSDKWSMSLLPAVMVVSGGTISAAGIACTAQLFHLVPNHGRAFYLNLSMITIGAGAAISPLLAGGVLSAVDSDWTIFALGMKFDIFQVIFAFGGLLMLAIIGILYFVQNVNPALDSGDVSRERV